MSWLSFEAMRPIIDRYGPCAIVTPALRGNRLVDLWLSEAGIEPEAGSPETALSLPHRFIAQVPASDLSAAQALASACEQSAQQALSRISEEVRAALLQQLSSVDDDWDTGWAEQTGRMLRVSVVATPCDCDTTRLADLLNVPTAPDDIALPTDGATITADDWRWASNLELANRCLETEREHRRFPEQPEAKTGTRPKCTLLGSWEQMGPVSMPALADFWRLATECWNVNGVRLRDAEKFCAQSLVKRFAFPAGLGAKLGIDRGALRFPDTATVAAAEWLREAGIDWQDEAEKPTKWSGRWLHQDDASDSEDGECPWHVAEKICQGRRDSRPPPKYYAVLQCDGDKMGEWLTACMAPRIEEFTGNGTAAGKLPPGPAWWAAMSEGLGNFAQLSATPLLSTYLGEAVYAGGDDALGLLPTANALACAKALRDAFRGQPHSASEQSAAPRGWLRIDGQPSFAQTLGQNATLSASIVIAHYKDDLRNVLGAARAGEQRAKDAGRDCLCVTIMRRSGEHNATVCRWQDIDWLDRLRRAFAAGASDRWAYRMRALLPTMAKLPAAAVAGELKRQVGRSDKESLEHLNKAFESSPSDAAAVLADELIDFIESDKTGGAIEGDKTGGAADFVHLCQAASFMVREEA